MGGVQQVEGADRAAAVFCDKFDDIGHKGLHMGLSCHHIVETGDAGLQPFLIGQQAEGIFQGFGHFIQGAGEDAEAVLLFVRDTGPVITCRDLVRDIADNIDTPGDIRIFLLQHRIEGSPFEEIVVYPPVKDEGDEDGKQGRDDDENGRIAGILPDSCNAEHHQPALFHLHPLEDLPRVAHIFPGFLKVSQAENIGCHFLIDDLADKDERLKDHRAQILHILLLVGIIRSHVLDTVEQDMNPVRSRTVGPEKTRVPGQQEAPRTRLRITESRQGIVQLDDHRIGVVYPLRSIHQVVDAAVGSDGGDNKDQQGETKPDLEIAQ